MAFFRDKNNSWLLLLVFLLSLPVLAQEIIFTDGFENHSPVIISTPILTGKVGEVYNYDVNATDIDGDMMLYLLTAAPTGMDINAVSGEISWTPDAEGDFPITVEVSDPEGGVSTQSWSINVAAGQDSDSDGLADYLEGLLGTDPNDPDSDDDGLNDGDEVNSHDSDPLDPDSDDDSLSDGNEVNTHSTDPTKIDTDGDNFGDGYELDAGTDPLNPNDFPAGPPDPAAIASSNDPTVITSLFDASSFIYEHQPPIQTGLTEGTIDPLLVAVIKGKLMARDGSPLPGVTVSVNQHAEFGQTISRVDGRFDLVVNGGSYHTIQFELSGYLPVQRKVDTPWQDYRVMDDVAMVVLDTQVTTIDLDSGVTLMAESSTSNDADGSRHSAIVFPVGTSAELVMDDGSTQVISSLNIRATEYTVGDSGPAAMPAELPSASGYTYAVELSADEAFADGVTGVSFSQPIFNYVENFLGFPVGTVVPSGYYDEEISGWIASENGLVIKVISISDGKVDVDIDGDEVADTGAALSGIGFTDAERQSLAASFTPGQSLWRVPTSHFTPWDLNWPFGPPPGAEPPLQKTPTAFPEIEEGICEAPANLEIQNQAVRQEVPITGTSFTLNYRSTNVPDRETGQSLDISLSEEEPVSSSMEVNSTEMSSGSIGEQSKRALKSPLNSHSVPPGLKKIELELFIAGQEHRQSFSPLPDQSARFTWDGKDAYSRKVRGKHTVTGAIGYVYDGAYFDPSDFESVFGRFGSTPIEPIRSRKEVILKQPFQAELGTFNASKQGLGGWMLSVHKSYDPIERVLVSGSGSTRSELSANLGVISRVAGSPDSSEGFSGDGGPAVDALLLEPSDVFALPDGGVLITDFGNNRIRRISPEGIISTIAGNGSDQYSGDGGPAIAAGTPEPFKVTMGPDGSIYYTNFFGHRIRKISPNGIITTIAGNGVGQHSGDGGLATLAGVNGPQGIAVAPDGTVYFTEAKRVRKIATNGIIQTIAGSDTSVYGGDGGPAIEATFGFVLEDIALGPDGNIFIAAGPRVRAIKPDGTILTIAGNGIKGFDGDGGPAWQAQLDGVVGLTVGKDALYIADDAGVVRKVDPDGIISTVVGIPYPDYRLESGNGGPVLGARFDVIGGLSVDPQERLYIVEQYDAQIRRAEPGMPGFRFGDIGLASLDASEYYQFNANGKHLRTMNSLTGAVMYEFDYNTDGLLTAVTDGYNKVTTIQHDPAGNPTAIVSPFGQVTSINVDRNGYINKISNPAGEKLLMESSPGGLITKTTDPRGKVSSFVYDDLGRLTNQSDISGFSQSLTRSQNPSGYRITRTTGLSRTATYDVDVGVNNAQQHTNTAPDGSTQTSQYNQSAGTQSSTNATGMTSNLQLGPSPRFGMQAPVVQNLEVGVSGGPTLSASSSSAASLAIQANPLSLETILGNTTIDGRMTISNYDALNRTQVITSPEGRTTTVEIDNLGRVVFRQYGDLAPLTASYNPKGQLLTLTSGTGGAARISSFTYGTDGFRKNFTDPLGRTSSLTRDELGRITSKTMPGGTSVLFSYNTAGDLAGISPPGRPQHSFSYTLHGQIDSVVPPDVTGSGPTDFNYNNDRQVTSISRPGGELIDYNYDDQGRLQTIKLSEVGTPVATYTFDYLIGTQLDSITGPGIQTVTYHYQGDLITGATWGGVVEGSFTRSYDNALRVSSATVNGVAPINFSYDDDDLLIDAGGFLISRSVENGLAQSTVLGVVDDAWVYNSFGEVEKYVVSANEALVYEANYTLDKLGRITKKIETIEGLTDIYNYAYDSQGQLTQVEKNAIVVESYSYDDNGNRLTAVIDGVGVSATYDDQDRLLTYGATSYEYTPVGRLLTQTRAGDQLTTFDYDIVGNLRAVILADSTEVSYGLDGPDRRVQRSVDGTITHRFLYDGILPIAQLDEFGNVVSRFVYAGSTVPAFIIRDGINYRLVTDQIGSVRLLVNTETGTIEQRLDYDGFGNVITDTNPGFQPFGYAGGIYDSDTGLVRFGFRDYAPEIGRWTAQDPIGFNGDDANLYRYVNNNPINFKDAAGLSGWDTALGFINGLNQGFMELVNPGLAIQHGIEVLSDYLLGDWLDEHGFYRDPYPGKLQAPPPGVDRDDYADGEFAGSCTVAVGSLFVGGGGAAGPAIASKLGSLAGKLKQIPGLAKRLSEGAKGLLKRGNRKELSKGVDDLVDEGQQFVDDLLKNGNFLGKMDDVGNLGSKPIPQTPGRGNLSGSGKRRGN